MRNGGHVTAHVEFVADEAVLLRESKTLVLARRPADNVADARTFLRTGARAGQVLVLEKPMAPTPQEALALAGELDDQSVFYAIPYLLNHCSWAQEAKQAVADCAATTINLDWSYHSPTVTSASWKSYPHAGGGAISYYFIHVLALASMIIGTQCQIVSIEERSTSTSTHLLLVAEGSDRRFTAQFATGAVSSHCSVQCDDQTIFSDATPFGSMPTLGSRDPRVDPLKRFYAGVLNKTADVANGLVFHLWSDAIAVLGGGPVRR